MITSAPSGTSATSSHPPRPPIERASANDMMQLATAVGSVPMQVGAILVLDTADATAEAVTTRAIHEALAARIQGVRRLRQRLVRLGPGCGRPVWVDDATFDIDEHIQAVACPAPGDETAILAVATDLIGTRLPSDRPLWSATIVHGLTGGRTAIIIVFDHVLADGIGGLAVLASLVDGMTVPHDDEFPRPWPTRRAAAIDAARLRLAAISRWRNGLDHLRAAVAELRPNLWVVAPRTSMNRPAGARRTTAVVRFELAPALATAHAHGATLNDVVLVAVTGALRAALDERGEHVDHLVVSVPISSRRAATSDQLGNEVGVLPIDIPTTGKLDERLRAVSRLTRARKEAPGARGSSAVVVGPLFRALRQLGVLRLFIDHQRLINTIITNLRGPDQRLSFAGATITDVLPVSILTGNVTVGFAVLSYAGTVYVTVHADADAWPDLARLTHHLSDAFGRSA